MIPFEVVHLIEHEFLMDRHIWGIHDHNLGVDRVWIESLLNSESSLSIGVRSYFISICLGLNGQIAKGLHCNIFAEVLITFEGSYLDWYLCDNIKIEFAEFWLRLSIFVPKGLDAYKILAWSTGLSGE